MHNGNTRRRRETKEILEKIMVENFPQFITDPRAQIQEAQRI